MDHTVLPAEYTMPGFTPQPHSITALVLAYLSFNPCQLKELQKGPSYHATDLSVYVNLLLLSPPCHTTTTTHEAGMRWHILYCIISILSNDWAQK